MKFGESDRVPSNKDGGGASVGTRSVAVTANVAAKGNIFPPGASHHVRDHLVHAVKVGIGITDPPSKHLPDCKEMLSEKIIKKKKNPK